MRGVGMLVAAAAVSVMAMACTITSNGKDDGSSGGSANGSSSGASGSSSGASGSSSGASGSSSGASGSSSGSSGGGKQPASTVSANLEINNACPAFQACGGSPDGTYDYTGGCIGDVFADARQQCPAMQTAGVTSTVTGSIYFLADSALERSVTAKVSGTLVFPADCTLGQCAVVQSGLASAFDTAVCTPQAGGCNCQVSRTEVTQDATTYTVNGETLTTADGDTYAICEKTGNLGYHGKSAGAEEGSFTLKKR